MILENFRRYFDLNRDTFLFKLLFPIKKFFSERFKQKHCIYYPELNCIFHHSLKCGGTSIKSVLEKYSRGILINKYDVKKIDAINFTFVRNPYDRLVSGYFFLANKKIIRYKYHFNKNISFKDYVKKIVKIDDYQLDNHFRPLVTHLSIGGKLPEFDFIGKVENINDDFKKLCVLIGIPKTNIPHKNFTHHKPWQKYYDSDLKKKVYKKYERDFIAFGYKK